MTEKKIILKLSINLSSCLYVFVKVFQGSCVLELFGKPLL